MALSEDLSKAQSWCAACARLIAATTSARLNDTVCCNLWSDEGIEDPKKWYTRESIQAQIVAVNNGTGQGGVTFDCSITLLAASFTEACRKDRAT